MNKPKVGSITVAEPWDKNLINPVRNTGHEYLKFINTAVFSEEARHFLRHGYYTNAPYGSKDWTDYWDEQERRCFEGYSVGGVRVSGRHYFFLNFSMLKARPIDPITGLEKDAKKIITFPRFLDHQYYLFLEIEECFAEGPHKDKALQGIIIAKSRRKGISFVNSGGVIGYNYNFVPSSLTTIAAYEAVHYNTLLNGTHFVLNHLNKNTDWAKRRQRVNRRDHFRSSFVYTNNEGVELEDGFMSEVQAKSFKDDPFKAIGDSTFTMCFEEAGRFKGLLDAYTIAEPTFRDGDIMTGVPMIWGTGGDIEAGGKDLEEMFYNPSAYGLKAYQNIYDENAVGDCGWFIDDMWYMPGENKERTHVLVDEQGNSYRDLAEKVLDDKRSIRATGSRTAYRKFVTQQPKCVSGDTRISFEGGSYRIDELDEKIENGTADLYDVITENQRHLTCTLNHHIFNGIDYKELSEYSIGDTIKLFPYVFNSEYCYTTIDTDIPILNTRIKIDEELAWFIGMFMGDGHFSGKNLTYELGMSFDRKDIESVEKYLNFTEKYFGKRPNKEIMGKENGGMRVRVTSKSLRYFMISLGIVYYDVYDERLKRNVHVPEYIKNSPKSVVSSFLNGVFDSDGGIYTSTKRIGLASKHEEFLKDISLLLTGFNIFTTNKCTDKINGDGRKFKQRSLYIDASHINKFAKDIRFTSKRKNDVLDKYALYETKQRKDQSYDRIKSISFNRNDLVYNLTTKCGYYGANGIWTHNSPKEAFLRVDSSPFDTLRAQSRLTNILTDQKTYINSIYTAKFVIESDSGEVKYEYDPDSIPLREFPIKDWDHVDGCPEIYEHPHRNNNGEIQPFRYIAGIDSYDADKSTTDSVGSFILLDRLTDRIVCHYKGRPLANKFYETCRRILKYYNATANYERSNKGIYGHFYNMKSLHLLCDEPDILKEKGISKANTIGNNSKGTAPSTQVNAWGRELTALWTETPAYGEDSDTEIINMDKIRSLGILREILSYNDDGNFDDISALGMLMIYRENIATTRIVKESQKKAIFEDPFWGRHTPGLQKINNFTQNKFR